MPVRSHYTRRSSRYVRGTNIMSATNRGATRQTLDYYGTPDWATRAIVTRLLSRGMDFGTVLEPGCGHGAIICTLLDMSWDPLCIEGGEPDQERAMQAHEN